MDAPPNVGEKCLGHGISPFVNTPPYVSECCLHRLNPQLIPDIALDGPCNLHRHFRLPFSRRAVCEHFNTAS